ncbi:serine protease [Agarilytica rhodophyticola]|uniref:serine protease n=1 Tax=Agarilytica rhodophyticola TaxID=1737490 RepID=UPI001FE7AE13|nr:serine protease [Agarilytica rhodophyticola]
MKTKFLIGASLTAVGLLTSCLSYAGIESKQVEPTLLKQPTPQMLTVATRQKFKANLSDYSSSLLTSQQSFDASDDERIIINKNGASFIKVHFSDFNIPEGSQVVVSNADGSQSHIYGAGSDTAFTVDKSVGDNGVKSFSALSIVGDTAIIKYIANGNEGKPYKINVDYFMEGYAEEIIEQMVLSQSVEQASTCGVNERRDVQCFASSHPTEFERTRPVARLLINGSGLCTAWRVGEDNHMFTNNHCVDSQTELRNTEVWFNYQRSSCSSGSPNTPTVVSGSQMLETDFTLDYTLFTVTNFNSIRNFGHFGLDVRNAVLQERIYIPQHGAGNPKELAVTSDQNTGNVCRIDDTVANGRGSNTDMGYFCDTIGGSSGSPVVAASSNNVIALHHFGGCLNQGVRISRIWPQVSSFFGGQIPTGDNGGSAPTPTPTPGNSGSQTDLSGNQGTWTHFRLAVPAGTSNLTASISGGSGDADLYVRRGQQPTTSSYQCRPFRNGNSETCSIDNPQADDWYISLRGYRAFSGVDLNWSYQ